MRELASSRTDFTGGYSREPGPGAQAHVRPARSFVEIRLLGERAEEPPHDEAVDAQAGRQGLASALGLDAPTQLVEKAPRSDDDPMTGSIWSLKEAKGSGGTPCRDVASPVMKR